MDFIGFEITDHAITDLVEHKRSLPRDTQIERALEAYSNLDNEDYHLSNQRRKGSTILGLFRANFARLDLRIDHHFPPRTENCTEGILREIFLRLTQEQQLMIQWQAFAPERASAIYDVPLVDIDLTHPNYAIVHIKAINTKVRFGHICLVPIELAKTIVESARSAGRKSPFPNYESQWKKITQFAREEYKVYLHSHYLRKRFQTIAESTQMPANHYALIMGDAPKEGHIPMTYSLSTQYQVFLNTLIQEYDTYLVKALSIDGNLDYFAEANANPISDLKKLQDENKALKEALAKLLKQSH